MNPAGAQPPSPTATSSVQVVVRLRPLNDKEKKHGTLPVVSASTKEKTVTVIKGQGNRQAKTSYKFDNVFTAFSTQEEVFEATLQPVIRDVLMGFESVVLSYGQTGTGKTHTMEGDLSHPELYGVIPRSAEAIFQTLEKPHYVEKSLSVSFLEIYNEELCDLLVDANAPNKAKLAIMEGKAGPFCRGLSETQVNSAEEVLALMRKAQNQRQVGETNMNKQSSRSHCIFTLKVQAKRKVGDGSLLEVSGKLHCVDLAGSECAKSADMEKQDDHQAARERERMNINRSLLTLGRVVSMLKEQSEGKKNIRIPYRDSKLTRILQESLGGRCKTCLIATVSPSITAIEESMSTLNYAQAANGIINKPVTSSLMTAQASGMAIDKKGSGGDDKFGTVEHWHEMECRLEYMQSQVEEAQQALARKHMQQQELIEKAESAEAARAAALSELEESQREKAALEEQVEQHVAENDRLSDRLVKTEKTLRETAAILKATRATEARLTSEAQALISVLQQSTADGDAMHQALIRNREEEIDRKNATKSFRESMLALLQETGSCLDALCSARKDHTRTIQDDSTRHFEEQTSMVAAQVGVVDELCKTIIVAIDTLGDQMSGENGITSTFRDAIGDVRHFHQVQQKTSSEYLEQTKSLCEGLRTRLVSSTETLQEMESRYSVSSARMVETLAQTIAESKENLSNFISSMMNALAVAKDERTQALQRISSMAENWKASSVQMSQDTGAVAKNQGDVVQSMLKLLTSEAKRHDEVLQELTNQKTFLGERRVRHLGELEKQNGLLVSQRAQFESLDKKANLLCNLALDNIMNGVRDLLTKEITAITQHQKDAAETFGRSYEGLVQSNQELVGSATDFFTRLESGNCALNDHGKVLRDVDTKAADVLGATRSTLQQIAEDGARQEVQAATNFEAITEFVVSTNEADAMKLEKMSGEMKEQGLELGTRFSTRLLQDIQESTHGLTDCSTKAFAFTKQHLVDDTRRLLEQDFETSAVSFNDNSRELANELLGKIASSEQKVTGIAGAHSKLLDETRHNLENRSGILRTGCSNQEKAMLGYQQLLSEQCNRYEKETEQKLGTCHEHTTKAEQSVGDYSNNVIKADDATPVLAERTVLSYNAQLSSTPTDSTILAALANKSMPDESSEHCEDAIMNNAPGGEEVCDDNRGTPSAPVLREQTNTTNISSSLVSSSGEVHKRKEHAGSAQSSSRPKRTRTLR